MKIRNWKNNYFVLLIYWQILLNTPTLQDRMEILEIHCKNAKIPIDYPSLLSIANATPGFVGADIRLLCEEIKRYISERKFSPVICFKFFTFCI